MTKTQLKKLTIEKFRALNDVEVELAGRITVICGKNGTSKSSILGVAAQIFSFDHDYVADTPLSFRTISGGQFKSAPTDHFRFSPKFDVKGSLAVSIEVHDGYTDMDATADLGLYKRANAAHARPVVRNNTTAKGKKNTSRNFTHPVVYLSLARLQPIATRDYSVESYQYLTDNIDRFIVLNNELLNKSSSAATGTGGALSSAVAHTVNYDQDSVSAGEDNAGQIILALMSFEKLKSEYGNDYKGGLLLIDEADAGLFPAAQLKLIEIMDREAKSLKLQVVMTSHSPMLVEDVYRRGQQSPHEFKTIYLSDTTGTVKAQKDVSWQDIYADLLIRTVRTASGTSLLPKVNVYFEDREGADFFNILVFRQPITRFLSRRAEVSLGCENYKHLIKHNVPEFALHSVIILDGDVSGVASMSSIVKLPGSLPPDQLIFQFLYNLPPEDEIWQNPIRFTRPVLRTIASTLITALRITDEKVDLTAKIKNYRKADANEPGSKVRELFKQFYKDDQFQDFLALGKGKDPWRRWIKDHPDDAAAFRTAAVKAVGNAMLNRGVDPGDLAALER